MYHYRGREGKGKGEGGRKEYQKSFLWLSVAIYKTYIVHGHVFPEHVGCKCQDAGSHCTTTNADQWLVQVHSSIRELCVSV